MSFVYSIFDILTADEIKAQFQDVEPAMVGTAYIDWLDAFERRANIFYRMQQQAHYIVVAKMYKEEFGRDPESIDTEGEQRRWDEFCTVCGLTKHIHVSRRAIDLLQDFHKYSKKEVSLDQLVIYHIDQLEATLLRKEHPNLMVPKIDAIWFNKVISNPPDQIARLRALPYGDYLRTDHWRRVRNAMLLIYGARCQANTTCIPGDSYWLGWEGDLHVHHLTYENRGCERFADLQLMCKHCHATEHGRTA